MHKNAGLEMWSVRPAEVMQSCFFCEGTVRAKGMKEGGGSPSNALLWYGVGGQQRAASTSGGKGSILSEMITALCRSIEDAGWVVFHCCTPGKECTDFFAAAGHFQVRSIATDRFVESRTIIRRKRKSISNKFVQCDSLAQQQPSC